MNLHRLAHRCAARPGWLWALAWLMLFKAALPMVAASAAHERGVALVEICSIYGVRTVALDHANDTEHGSEHTLTTAADTHGCPLASALGATLRTAEPWPLLAPARLVSSVLPTRLSAPTADAVRRWQAWRQHAPPHLG